MQRLTHWIDGAARAPLEDRWLEVDDPATGAAFAEVAAGTALDAVAAVDAVKVKGRTVSGVLTLNP